MKNSKPTFDSVKRKTLQGSTQAAHFPTLRIAQKVDNLNYMRAETAEYTLNANE
nr:MAG TPA: hypothetical protein [Caudoviricetes sp.]